MKVSRVLKKAIALTTMTILCFVSMNSGAFAQPSTWAQLPLVKLELLNVVEGKLADPSLMQRNITREEFAEMAIRLHLALSGQVLASLAQTENFTDTDNAYVGAASRLGIVNGVGDNKFEPRANVTREQMATILYRTLTQLNLVDPNIGGQTATFVDSKSISSWAMAGVTYAKAAGIIEGVGQNKFAPTQAATREQVYKIVEGMLSKHNKSLFSSSVATFNKTLNGYTLPSSTNTSLSLSANMARKLELRIQSGLPKENISDLIGIEWIQIYQILQPKWGHAAARAVVLDAKAQWQQTLLGYTTDRSIFIDPKGIVSTSEPKSVAFIKLSYEGVLTIDCMTK